MEPLRATRGRWHHVYPPRPVGHPLSCGASPPCPVGRPLMELASRHFDIQGCRSFVVRRAVAMVRTTADTSRSTWNHSGRRRVAGTTCIPCPCLPAPIFVWTIAGFPWSSQLNRIKWQVDRLKTVISEYLVPPLGILKVLEPHHMLCSRLAESLPHSTSQTCSGTFTSN